MAKKENNIPKKPRTAAPAEEVKVETVEAKVPTSMAQMTGLSQDSKVLYADLMQRRYIEHPQEDAKYTPEFIGGINMLIDATIMSVAVDEVVNGTGSLAMIIQKNPEGYARLSNMAKGMGITLPNYNLLEAPTKEQLDKVNLPENVNKEDVVVVEVTGKDISEETKKIAKEEKEAQEKEVELDPTKITNDEQLKDALKKMLSVRGSVYENLFNAINFFRSVKTIQAGENKELVDKINSLSTAGVINEISLIVGSCPFILDGIANYMFNVLATTKNPIVPFVVFRATCINKNTNELKLSEKEIAQVVSALIVWKCKAKIAEQEKNIEVLKKDKKANAKAIEQANENIAWFNSIMQTVVNPSADCVHSIVENLDSENKELKDDARRAFGYVANAYLGKKYAMYNTEDVTHNVEIYAGMIINLFREEGSKLEGYTEDALVELRPLETKKEEKKEEQDSKN